MMLQIAYIGLILCIGYVLATILIGFPCSVWEAVTKKEMDYDKKQKVIYFLAICLDILLVIRYISEKLN